MKWVVIDIHVVYLYPHINANSALLSPSYLLSYIKCITRKYLVYHLTQYHGDNH